MPVPQHILDVEIPKNSVVIVYGKIKTYMQLDKEQDVKM